MYNLDFAYELTIYNMSLFAQNFRSDNDVDFSLLVGQPTSKSPLEKVWTAFFVNAMLPCLNIGKNSNDFDQAGCHLNFGPKRRFLDQKRDKCRIL